MKTTNIGVAVIAFAAALAGCAVPPTTPDANSKVGLQRVATFNHQVTGVAVVGDGRTFVSFPRWTEDSEISVGELIDGRVVPYPDAQWNSWRNARKDQMSAEDHFVCVQNVVVDHGSLWVLDPAAPAMGTVVEKGPKLVQIDLATNRLVRTIAFPDAVAPQGSYLNDVRFSPDGRHAYITDSGAKGAIVVVDVTTGQAHRALDGDPSTQSDKTVTVMYRDAPLRRPDGRGVEFSADGIALSIDGKTLYWQAIKGKTLYSVPTAALDDPAVQDVARQVWSVGENGPADGLIISRHDGRMYITSPQDDSIKVRDLNTPQRFPAALLQDARLRWPDTFSEGPDGSLYVTTSRIQDSAFFKADAPAALSTTLWRLTPLVDAP